MNHRCIKRLISDSIRNTIRHGSRKLIRRIGILQISDILKQCIGLRQIQDINAKTEKIQAEDRTLELRLRQLDTEQDALQTEMEAVKKVIEKNIESTFKTFE